MRRELEDNLSFSALFFFLRATELNFRSRMRDALPSVRAVSEHAGEWVSSHNMIEMKMVFRSAFVLVVVVTILCWQLDQFLSKLSGLPR